MKKLLLLIVAIIIFAAGFLTHALFFPDFLANGISDVTQLALPNPTPTGSSLRPLTTTINYDGARFSRHNITIEVGTYLAIENTSLTELMWLHSDDPSFITPRGYGQSEALQKRMDTRGRIIIEDKNNPQEKLVVTIK